MHGFASALNLALPYLGFGAAGICFTVPGALVPWLLSHLALKDAQAGLFLFLFSVGTTTGALLSRGSLRRSISLGAACTSIGSLLLALAWRWAAWSGILIYGLGLGLIITSLSMLQSRRRFNDRTAEMTRLNLLWAAGACAGPWLVMRGGLRNGISEEHILLFLTVAFAAYMLASLILAVPPAQLRTLSKAPSFALRAAPWPLLLMVFCITGVESACGGWLAAYSQRNGNTLGITIGAPTCLWCGLLSSRVVHSNASIGRATQRMLLSWNLVGLTAAIVTLIVSHGGAAMLLAAFVLGFASGPMYPLLLSLIFKYDEGNMIFVLAGIGSASLPLLAGALSTAAGSLRIGLLVPAVGAVALTTAGWATAQSERARRS